MPLTNEDETCRFCQGLSLRKTSPGRGKMSPVGDKKGNELSSAARLRGFVPEGNPLRHGFAVPPLPKGRGFGRGGTFTAYRLTSSAVDE